MYTQLIFIMNNCQYLELGSFTDDQNSKLGAGREQGKAPLIYKVWYKWLSCIFDRILHTFIKKDNEGNKIEKEN